MISTNDCGRTRAPVTASPMLDHLLCLVDECWEKGLRLYPVRDSDLIRVVSTEGPVESHKKLIKHIRAHKDDLRAILDPSLSVAGSACAGSC